MGLNPASPEMVMLLVMLHTGTMFAVIAYFWKDWQRHYFSAPGKLRWFAILIVVATACTIVVGLGMKELIEKVFMHGAAHAEIEELFSNLPLMAGSLAAVGVLIIIAGLREEKTPSQPEIQPAHAVLIGIVQGLCLPFRGFSRSGSTISTGLLLGLPKKMVEEFSFALAVVLTPLVIAQEALRLHKSMAPGTHLSHMMTPGLIGMVFSFLAGLLALKWLSRWLEGGRWKFFGIYCLVASAVVLAVNYKLTH